MAGAARWWLPLPGLGAPAERPATPPAAPRPEGPFHPGGGPGGLGGRKAEGGEAVWASGPAGA